MNALTLRIFVDGRTRRRLHCSLQSLNDTLPEIEDFLLLAQHLGRRTLVAVDDPRGVTTILART